jgi:hypothetical protein
MIRVNVMKQKSLLFILIILMLCGCKKASDNLYYDKQYPVSLEVAAEFLPLGARISGPNLLGDLIWVQEGEKIVFDQNLFLSYVPGEYVITVYTKTESLELNLTIAGFAAEEDVIVKTDLFVLEKSVYLVYFSKDGCSGCEAVFPKIREYYDLTSSLNYPTAVPIFSLKYEDPANASLFGSEDNVLGVTDAESLMIPSFPTVIVIENQTVVEYFHGSSEVGEFMDQMISACGQYAGE